MSVYQPFSPNNASTNDWQDPAIYRVTLAVNVGVSFYGTIIYTSWITSFEFHRVSPKI